jgi:acetolactate synthase I/II/III large subunit
MIKLSDYIMEFIADRGVKDIFMLPGGGCMHLVDSLGRNKRLRAVSCLHEQAAAISAEAYGQYTNNLGVCLVTTGPGGTNAITGVAGAWLDSTPLLIVSGQVKREDLIDGSGLRQKGFQEINIVDIVKPITKYAVTILDPKLIRWHLEEAMHLACTGRPGPVWIDIPLDIQAMEIDETRLSRFDISLKHASPRSFVQGVVNLFRSSKRPVLLAGNGIRLAKAGQEFIELIELLGIPVLTTWKAADLIPEDHPLYCGRPGSVGQRGANFIQQNADCLISIGARLDHGQTAYNLRQFAPEAAKIIIDIDSAEIEKLNCIIGPDDGTLVMDAGDFIREFIRQIPHSEFLNMQCLSWLFCCKNWQKKYPVILSEYWKEKDFINPYCLIDALSDEMTEGDILIPGSSGSAAEIVMQAFRIKKGQRVLNTPGLGAMGFGIPAAIGACIASGGKRTICIEGDGSFHMNSLEMETISRLNLPIKIFVLSNNGYASIRNMQQKYFDGRLVGCGPSSGLTFPELIGIGQSCGIPSGARINSNEAIRYILHSVMEHNDPTLIEVMVAPDHKIQPRTSSRQCPDGSMETAPMEDLWPFLPRDEFIENMRRR